MITFILPAPAEHRVMIVSAGSVAGLRRELEDAQLDGGLVDAPVIEWYMHQAKRQMVAEETDADVRVSHRFRHDPYALLETGRLSWH